MENLLENRKTLVIVIAAVLVLAIAIFWSTRGGATAAPPVGQTEFNAPPSADGQTPPGQY